MTSPNPDRPVRALSLRRGRRWAAGACAAALGAMLLVGCNAGNGDAETGSDTTPGPPLPSVELPHNPELKRPFGVQTSGFPDQAPPTLPSGEG